MEFVSEVLGRFDHTTKLMEHRTGINGYFGPYDPIIPFNTGMLDLLDSI